MKTFALISLLEKSFVVFNTHQPEEKLLAHFKERQYTEAQEPFKKLIFANDLAFETIYIGASEHEQQLARETFIKAKELEGFQHLLLDTLVSHQATQTTHETAPLQQNMSNPFVSYQAAQTTHETAPLQQNMSKPFLLGMVEFISLGMAIVAMIFGVMIINTGIQQGIGMTVLTGVGIITASVVSLGMTYGFISMVKAQIDIRNILVAQLQQPAQK